MASDITERVEGLGMKKKCSTIFHNNVTFRGNFRQCQSRFCTISFFKVFCSFFFTFSNVFFSIFESDFESDFASDFGSDLGSAFFFVSRIIANGDF